MNHFTNLFRNKHFTRELISGCINISIPNFIINVDVWNSALICTISTRPTISNAANLVTIRAIGVVIACRQGWSLLLSSQPQFCRPAGNRQSVECLPYRNHCNCRPIKFWGSIIFGWYYTPLCRKSHDLFKLADRFGIVTIIVGVHRSTVAETRVNPPSSAKMPETFKSASPRWRLFLSKWASLSITKRVHG